MIRYHAVAARMPSLKNVHPCTFFSIEFFGKKNSMVLGTTDILSDQRRSRYAVYFQKNRGNNHDIIYRYRRIAELYRP